MSRDLVEDLTRLESYGIERESDYVLATPELLTNPDGAEYLRQELLKMGFRLKQLPKVCRLIKNVVASARTQILTVKHVPSADAIRRLHDAGFSVVIVKASTSGVPSAVSIKTKLGILAVWMSVPELKPIVDIYDWGLPETPTC